MGNSYVGTAVGAKSASNGGGFYRQYEHSFAPTFDSHTMIFEPSSSYLNWNQTMESEHDGTAFVCLGNYQYGQLLHKRPPQQDTGRLLQDKGRGRKNKTGRRGQPLEGSVSIGILKSINR